jgi:hypothetical protein
VRLRERVTGQLHPRNLDRWPSLIETRDVLGLHPVLTGLDRESIEMREVSPMGGLLSQQDRADVSAGRTDASRPARARHPNGLARSSAGRR